jgi:hypothetical protein
MDVRSTAGLGEPYFTINREERFFCATLYSLLVQKNDNLKRFVSFLNSRLEREKDRVDEQRADDFEIYVEYSYLRDRWNSLHNNEEKWRLIFDSLQLSDTSLSRLSVPQLNAALVGFGEPSSDQIQNPGTWSISRYSNLFPRDVQGNRDFERLCKFKWCFKIKPDLVIQVNPNRVLSIEAKLESREGTYPAPAYRKEWIEERHLDPVKQTGLQSFMFDDILNMRASLFYLVKESSRDRRDGIPVITWQEVFGELDLTGTHPFVPRALKAKGWWSPVGDTIRGGD